MGMLHGVTGVLRREFGTGKWRFGGARFEPSRVEKVAFFGAIAAWDSCLAWRMSDDVAAR